MKIKEIYVRCWENSDYSVLIIYDDGKEESYDVSRDKFKDHRDLYECVKLSKFKNDSDLIEYIQKISKK